MHILPPGHRHRRRAHALSLRWQRRLVFVLGGGVVGVAAIVLALAADRAGAAFEAVAHRLPLAVLLLLVGLLCGASIGREGPTVQVGASIMFAIGRMSPRRQPGLLLASVIGYAMSKLVCPEGVVPRPSA